MTAEDQARTEQRRIHEEALVRRHAFWCKPWEKCTCNQNLHLAPRKPAKPYNPNDQLIGPKAKESTDANQTK